MTEKQEIKAKALENAINLTNMIFNLNFPQQSLKNKQIDLKKIVDDTLVGVLDTASKFEKYISQ